MSKDDIVLDWLRNKENRDKIPVKEMKQTDIDAFEHYGFGYTFDGDKMYCLSEQIFKIKIKDDAAS